MDKLTATKLEWALKYASLGYAVFPCSSNGKTPAKGCLWTKDATSDPDKVRQLWEKFGADCNIGVKCGPDSDLTVLDVDDIEAYADWLGNKPEVGAQNVLWVNTVSGGYHVYFKYEPKARTGVKRVPGCDYRSLGGYVIGAGSQIDGDYYEVDEMSDFSAPLKPFPTFLLPPDDEKPVETPLNANDEVWGDVGEGGRNHFLAQAAGRLRRLDLLNFQTLQSINLLRCSPPLPNWEVKNIVDSVMRYKVEEPLVVNLPESSKDSDTLSVYAPDLIDQTIEFLKDKKRIQGIPTCFKELNALIGGGLAEGRVYELLAPAKFGKSTVLHQIIQGLLKDNVQVAYASREMDPAVEVLPNILSIEFNKRLTAADITEDLEANIRAFINNAPLLTFTAGYGTMPTDSFEKWVRIHASRGVKLFFIDHLLYMVEDEDHLNVSTLVKRIKSLANDLDITFFIIVQPKNIEPGRDMDKTAVRGGASIVQAADCLMALKSVYTAGKVLVPNKRYIEVMDIRGSMGGSTGKVVVEYCPETMRVSETFDPAEEKAEEEKEVKPSLQVYLGGDNED